MIARLTAEQRGYLYGIVGVTMFGLTLPATRLAVLELDPLFVACGRAVLAGLCAFALVAATRAPWPPRHLMVPLFRYGACVIFGFPILMTVAMRFSPATHGGVILSILPLATAMAGVLVAGERPSRGFWACGIAGSLAVSGYVVLKAGTGGGALADGDHWADLLLVGAVLAASWGYAEGAVVTRTLGGWQAISWALILALPVMSLITLAVLLTGGLTGTAGVGMRASWPAWAGFLYVGIGSMYLGFFAWNRGLNLGGIAKVGQTQLLQTFVTLAGAALLLGETVGLMELAFATLVVALVALGSRMRVKR
jgi:drug/metabolite transporter (DMT)-like permease